MRATVVVSLSGIDHDTVGACAEFARQLDQRRVPLSLLLAPARAGGGQTLDWVRTRRAQGDAVVLHGYDHTADPIGTWAPNGVTRIGRRAEFAMLPAHEAGLRLVAANRALDGIGLRTPLFAPPRWLASAGTIQALTQHDFRVCADATSIRDLWSGTVRRGRVYELGGGFGGQGDRVEHWWCRAVVLAVSRAARRGGLVRLTVDAAVLDRVCDAALDAVDATMSHGARPVTYAAADDDRWALAA